MTNAQIILETARWLEGRLGEELPVTTLAAKSGYSLHHFVRLFAGVLGLPPKEYILRRKLSEAGRALAAGKRRVVDVALDFGFKDHETFTRAFVRMFGVTPSAVRRGSPFPYFGPPAEAARPAAPIVSAPDLERFDACLLAGYQLRLTQESGEVGRLWARLAKRAWSVPGRRKPERFRQLATYDESDEDWVDILAAVEMETLDKLPLDLVGKAMPACECLVFTHRGSVARVGESYKAIYAEILPALARRPAQPFNFETYFEDAGDPYSSSYRFKICIPLA